MPLWHPFVWNQRLFTLGIACLYLVRDKQCLWEARDSSAQSEQSSLSS